jgi:hypothetical protein
MKQTSDLIAELEQATSGLLFQSESDYPLEPFSVSAQGGQQLSAKVVLETKADVGDLPVSEVALDDFFRIATEHQDWHGLEEQESVARFRKLLQILKENLTDIKVYRVGEVEVDVFIIGKTRSGDYAGVSTKVVET